jgi:Essential protein Yae1, N terminal
MRVTAKAQGHHRQNPQSFVHTCSDGEAVRPPRPFFAGWVSASAAGLGQIAGRLRERGWPTGGLSYPIICSVLALCTLILPAQHRRERPFCRDFGAGIAPNRCQGMKLPRNDGGEAVMASAPSDALLNTPSLLESNTATANNQLLNDVFSNSPPPSPTNASGPRLPSAPPSDVPRLRAQHHNAGYLNGVTLSKPAHLQRGFDSGYPLGASLGLRVGYILGVLAGLRESQLLKTATEELELNRVLGEAEDGWGKWLGVNGKEGDQMGGCYPVIERWVETVERVARRVGLNLRMLDGEGDGETDNEHDKIPAEAFNSPLGGW